MNSWTPGQGKGPEAQGCPLVSLENWLPSSLLHISPSLPPQLLRAAYVCRADRPAEVGTALTLLVEPLLCSQHL